MRTPYITIAGMAPDTRDTFRAMLKDPEKKEQLERHFEEKLRPAIKKLAGEEMVDYESWMVFDVIPGEKFLELLNPDESLPFSARIPDYYIFEGWLDSDGTIKDTDTFEDELEKLKNTLIIYFNIDF